MVFSEAVLSAPIDTEMDVENNPETLPFLNGKPEDLKERVKGAIMKDLQISNKIAHIKALLGEDHLFNEWMYEVTRQKQLEKLSRTQQDWNPEKFECVVSCISQLTTDEAEQFFSFCRQNVVNKKWPEEYAMDLAKHTLNEEAKTGQQQNKGDSPWEMIDGHEPYPSTPAAERIQQPEKRAKVYSSLYGFSLNDIVPGPEEISTSETETAGREPDQKDSLTIVFMGMSGSGKTTMVNGIANSFRYETFDKALKSGPRVVVPTRFTTFVGSKARIVQPALTINSHNQKNKNLNDGTEPVTMDPMIHQLSYNTAAGKVTVRIVDTPGLNDTEGCEQDNTNLDKTFTFLEKLDKIDSICIVLKANESRLTFSLELALKNLLRRLQRSAYNNVVFVFTNGKTPGGSLALLRDNFKDVALNTNKENWFAFDNEPFRYLCTVKEYPKATNGERKEECQELFDHNVEELERLLERAQCLPSFKMPPGPVERKEAALGQVMACNASIPDKIGSGTSLNNKTLWRMEQGPSTSGSLKQERSLTGVAVPAKAVPVHDAQKQADKEKDLRLKEKIEHDRTCRIVEALTEPLALQIFDNCKQMLVLSDEIDQIQKDINRLNKGNFISCHSCNGQRCSGYFDGVNLCRDCYHHVDHHVNVCQNLDKLNEANASFAIKMSAREELEREDTVLRSACHHFSFFLTTEHQYPFFTNFEKAMMNQLEMRLDESQKIWLSPSIQSFLTVFRRNIENDEQGQTYGEFVTVENTKKKLVELKQLKIFGPRAAQIINLYHPVPIF